MADRPAFAPHAAGPLLLTTLGGTGLARAQSPPTPILGPGKPLALLTYLALSPGRAATRDHLLDLLWADLPPDSAGHTLRQTLWSLRRRLGEHALVMNGDGQLALAVPVDADRDAFLAAVDTGDGERAVALYRGEFLPGFAAPGGAAFEQWADSERFRLRLLFQRTGEAVVRQRLSRGRFREAQALARRLRDAEPARETGWRLLIESLLAGRDRLGAMVEVEALRRALADDEREPEPATRALLKLVSDDGTPGQESTDTSRRLVAELIGREQQFASLMAAWDSARLGAGRHVHVSAPAGLGKTRLLTDVYSRLRAQGARVALVRANPGERHIEYAFAADLAAALGALPGAAGVSPATAAALVALNPVLSSRFTQAPDRATGAEALRRRAIALCEAVTAVAEEAPLALLLDDAHWADPASRDVVQTIVDRLSSHRVLMITAARPTPGAAFTAATTHALTLEPLSPEDVGAVVASLGALPEAPWAALLPPSLHAATAGSPLLVLDTLHWLIERELLNRGPDGWVCCDSGALSRELAAGSALRRRVDDLDRRPAWVMLVLAEVGTPVPVDRLARIAGVPTDTLAADLAALEQQGLAARAGEEWQTAHDEIAAAAHDTASPEARRAANAGIGRVLAEAAGDDAPLLYKAGRHLAAAGEDADLERVFRTWVPLVRRRRDRRGLRALAADILGNGPAPGRVARLVRSLPAHVRLGLTTPARIAAAVAAPLILGGAIAALALRPAPPPPDAVLVVVRQAGGDSLRAVTVPLRRQGWEGHPTIDVTRAGAPYPTLSAADLRGLAPAPDGERWVFSRLVSDSAGIKLFVLDRSGVARQVTDSIRDDGPAAWSPDGRSIVFQTERWSENRWADLAILDLATAQVRRITATREPDGPARWSPDGTRIAFNRQSFEGESDLLCWTTPDGAVPHCLRAGQGGGVLAWYDAQRVLVTRHTAGATVLGRLDLASGETAVMWQGVAGPIAVSPDGRWVACWCVAESRSQPTWFVGPTDRPDLARRVTNAGEATPGQVTMFWTSQPASQHIERIRIDTNGDTIPLGSGYRLRAVGLDATGNTVGIPVLEWRSEDTTVATVDEDVGTVRPRREGAVAIVASAGGWRLARRTFIVGPARSRVVLREDWTTGLGAWVAYGDPRPAVTSGPQGTPAFWNQGDGWFVSGAYSRAVLRPSGGAGVEFRVSTPLAGPRQQMIHARLAPWADSLPVAQWDHRTGAIPLSPGHCAFQYGVVEGSAGTGALFPGGVRVAADHWMSSGRWYTIRIQLFPDGRCGLAVNGMPVSIDDPRARLDQPFRIVLEGNSLGNKMLVGPLEAWAGVRDGVDWLRLDARR